LVLIQIEIFSFGLDDNSLSGSIPPEFGISWKKIEFFSLFKNRLNGSIPSSFCNFQKLTEIEYIYSSLTVHIIASYNQFFQKL
jgi:hypothetical protein